MKLLGISIGKRGFTIVELLIVLGIGVLMAVAVVPIYSNLVPASDSAQVASEIVQTIRTARARSVARLGNSSYGVKFLPDKYILYRGASYAAALTAGTLERTITLGGAFLLTTTLVSDDVNFSKGIGVPNTGVVTLSRQSADPKTISINQFGMVEVQ